MAPGSMPNPTHQDCQGKMHPKAAAGIALFNAGEYWKAHEALEEAWLEEQGEIRHLYRAILQVGVAYLHVQRRNYRGAVKMYLRCQRWLAPFPDHCRGLDVGQLRSDFEAVIHQVRSLEPNRMDQFDLAALRPLVFSELEDGPDASGSKP